jgi:hypothetical protein
MARWRSIVGAALALLALAAVLVWLTWERIRDAWRARLEERRRRAMAQHVQAIHQLVDDRRDALLAGKVREAATEAVRDASRDPVDVANEIIQEARRGRQ